MIGVKKNRVAEHNLPSGKLSHNYGKSPFFMGKSTISMAIFYVANC